jgi:hypothetical protein
MKDYQGLCPIYLISAENISFKHAKIHGDVVIPLLHTHLKAILVYL